jgi:hypothetical protein
MGTDPYYIPHPEQRESVCRPIKRHNIHCLCGVLHLYYWETEFPFAIPSTLSTFVFEGQEKNWLDAWDGCLLDLDKFSIIRLSKWDTFVLFLNNLPPTVNFVLRNSQS